MMGMSPYEFDQHLKQQIIQNQRIALDSWMLAGITKTSWSFPAFFSRKPALERQAYSLLEDLLKHEKPEIRLRAAEIIVGRRGRRAHLDTAPRGS